MLSQGEYAEEPVEIELKKPAGRNRTVRNATDLEVALTVVSEVAAFCKYVIELPNCKGV